MAEAVRKRKLERATSHATNSMTMDAAPMARKRGLSFRRYFTRPDVDPFSMVEWDMRSAVISGEKGEVVFEQKDVEIPRHWSQLATSVVVSKYFRGPLGSPEREHSVRQLIGRVVRTIHGWGERQGYFASRADADAFAAEL